MAFLALWIHAWDAYGFNLKKKKALDHLQHSIRDLCLLWDSGYCD